MTDELVVGYVAGAHGVAGTLRIKLHDARSEALAPGVKVVLAQAGRRHGPFEVRSVESLGDGRTRVQLAQVRDRNSAEALRGCEVRIERTALPSLQDDEFYLADAMGLPVVRRRDDGEEQPLGVIVSVITAGPQDLFEVEWTAPGGDGVRWLLPVGGPFIRAVEADRVVVEVPLGLLPPPLEEPS